MGISFRNKGKLGKPKRPRQTPRPELPTAGNRGGKRPQPRAEERPRAGGGGDERGAVGLRGSAPRTGCAAAGRAAGATGLLTAQRDGGVRVPGGGDPAARRRKPRLSPGPRPLLQSPPARSYRKRPQRARVSRVWRQRRQRQLPATRRTEGEVSAAGSDAMMRRKPLVHSLAGGRERPLAAWRRGGLGGECVGVGGVEELWERPMEGETKGGYGDTVWGGSLRRGLPTGGHCGAVLAYGDHRAGQCRSGGCDPAWGTRRGSIRLWGSRRGAASAYGVSPCGAGITR